MSNAKPTRATAQTIHSRQVKRFGAAATTSALIVVLHSICAARLDTRRLFPVERLKVFPDL